MDYETIKWKHWNEILNENDNKTIHRLTNILYKAINICYDNKSDFSINLIILTKKALKNSSIFK